MARWMCYMTLNFPIQDWDRIWESTGTVSEKLGRVPEGQLFVTYPYGVQIRPNDSITTGLVSVCGTGRSIF